MGIFSKLTKSSGSRGTDHKGSSSSSAPLIELKSRVRETCAWTNQYRKEFPLTELEMAFSYSAFVWWYLTGKVDENEGTGAHFLAANETARDCAIYTAKALRKYPYILDEVKKYVPTIDITRELEWAAERGDNPQWHVSFTRGLILGCRALAYSVSEYMGLMQPLGSQIFAAYVLTLKPAEQARLSTGWLGEFLTPESVESVNHSTSFLARCSEGA